MSELTEPFDIQEVHIDGIGRVEHLDSGLLGVTLFRRKRGDNIANIELIVSQANVPSMLVTLAKAIGCDMVPTCPAVRRVN